MLRSVCTKTLRDQRWPVFAWSLGLGLMSIIVGAGWAHSYPDQASRLQLAQEIKGSLSIASLLYGEPHRIETLAGFIEWRTLGLERLIVAIFMVLAAASSTRGGEELGTIECVASAPLTRLRVFAEQSAAVATALGATCLLIWLAILVTGPVAGQGAVPTGNSLLAVANLFLVGLLAAGLALVFGHFTTSRREAALIAGVLMTAMYIWDNLCYVTTSLSSFRWLSPLYLSSRSTPLSTGHLDIFSFAGLAAIAFALVALACWLTPKRDLFGVLRMPWRKERTLVAALPNSRPFRNEIGLRSAFLHTVVDARVSILAWGVGLAMFAALMAGITPKMREAFAQQSGGGITKLLNTGSITDTAVMSFAVFGILPLFLTFFALTLAASWTAEELDGRLELELAAPMPRYIFFLQKAAASGACVLAVAALMGGGMFIAMAAVNVDVSWSKALLALVLLLPLASVVVAFGFFVSALRPRLVVAAGAFVLLASFLLDLVVPLFNAPNFLRDLSVFHLYGTPLDKGPDWLATAAISVVAAGLLAGGSLVFERRDINR